MSNLHLTKGSPLPKFPDDGKLRLYSMRFCPFAQRAHLVLDAKKIPYHTSFIHLKVKPEWYTQKSPLGKVPALELPSYPGEPLIESLIICDYLDEKYPENPLHSEDPLQRAKDRILIERFNEFISPFYFRLIYLAAGVDGVPAALADANKVLDIFEEELKKRGSKFFGGVKPGMVDYMIWPWLERTDILPLIIGDSYEMDKTRFAKIIEWKTEMKQDSAVKATALSGEDYLKFRDAYLDNPDNPNCDILQSV